MAIDNIFLTLQNLGLAQILLFLLSFAVVYGILKQYKIPNSNAAQALIGLAMGFLVLMAAPLALVSVLTAMSSSLILVGVGFLVLIIFLEVTGMKVSAPVYDAKGKHIGDAPGSIFQKYGYFFAIIIGIIAILIFINSGGLALLGMQSVVSLNSTTTMSIAFFLVIVLAIFWMVSEKKQE
jgi:hypothetical protein